MMQLNSMKDTQAVSSQKITLKKQHSSQTYSDRILYRLKKRKLALKNSGVLSEISNFIYSSLLSNLFDSKNKLSENLLKEINNLEWTYPFLDVDKIIQDSLKEIVTDITGKKIQLKDNDDLKRMKKADIDAIQAKVDEAIKKEEEQKKSLQNILLQFLSPKLDIFIKQFRKKDEIVDSMLELDNSNSINNLQEKYSKWQTNIFEMDFLPDLNLKKEIKQIFLQVEQTITPLNDKYYEKKIESFTKETSDTQSILHKFKKDFIYKIKKAFTKLLVKEIHKDIDKLENRKLRFPTFVDEFKYFQPSYEKSKYEYVIPSVFRDSQISILKNYGLNAEKFTFSQPTYTESNQNEKYLDWVINLSIPTLNDDIKTIDVEFWKVGKADEHQVYEIENIFKEIKQKELFSNFFNDEEKTIYERDVIGSDKKIFSDWQDFQRHITNDKKEIKWKKITQENFFTGKAFLKFDADKQELLKVLKKFGINTFALGIRSRGLHYLQKALAVPSFFNDKTSFSKNSIYLAWLLNWPKIDTILFEIEEIFNEFKKPENEIKFIRDKKDNLDYRYLLLNKNFFDVLSDKKTDLLVPKNFYHKFTNWEEVIKNVKASNENINWDKYKLYLKINKKLHSIDMVIKTKVSEEMKNVPEEIKRDKTMSITNDVIMADDKWMENLKESSQTFKREFVKFKLKSETNALKTLLQKWNLKVEDYLKFNDKEINALISPKKIDESILYEGLEPLLPGSNLNDNFENFMKSTIKKEYKPSSISIVIPGKSDKEKMLTTNRNLRLVWNIGEYSLKRFLAADKLNKVGELSKDYKMWKENSIVIEVPLVSSKVSPFLSNENLKQKGQEAQGKIKNVLDKIKQNPRMYQKLLAQFPELKSKLQKMDNIFKFFSQARGKNNKIKITEDQLKNLEKLLKENLEELQKKLPELFLGSKIINNLTKAFKGQIPKVVWKFIEKYPNIVRELANSQLDYSTIAKMLGSKKMRRHLTSFTNWKNILPKAEIIAKNYKYAYLASATGLGVAGITSSVVSLSGALKRIKKNKSGIYFSRFVVSITAIVGVTLILISSALFIFFFLKQGGWNA